MKYIPTEKLIAEIERRIEEYNIQSLRGAELSDLLSFITSLQKEQPKFNVGDLVVSKKNPHLTYRILATNIPNELGKTDYKVEIFTDGKQGLLSELHNIHLISSDKIEDWGELVQPDGLDEEVKKYWNAHALDYRIGRVADLDFMLLCARHFAEWGVTHLNARKEY